jgi:RNA polymerase sigma factor (sigma-70 family)
VSQGLKSSAAARKRAAVEMIARHEATLKRTARRYSFDEDDVEDAYQRALEIVLTKAPTTDQRELIRWTQTVTKHEALALRQSRERLLGYRREGEGPGLDPIATLPARDEGPDEQVQRRESIARSREALRTLKPAELRALSLLAEGYSYAEIGTVTGFSQTKVNRVLAEGRARFRSVVSRSEDGRRCAELQPLLSAFCDGEAGAAEAALVREHLRACAHCRATLRAYRAAPRLAAALVPAALPSRPLLDRVHDFLGGLGSRLPGLGGGDVPTQIAASGGARGAGFAGLAKLLALCAGAAGGAACVAAGVLPAPVLDRAPVQRPHLERPAVSALDAPVGEEVSYDPIAPPPAEAPANAPEPNHEAAPEPTAHEEAAEASAGAIEYEPPPPPEPAPAESAPAPSSTSGSAAGEFGP